MVRKIKVQHIKKGSPQTSFFYMCRLRVLEDLQCTGGQRQDHAIAVDRAVLLQFIVKLCVTVNGQRILDVTLGRIDWRDAVGQSFLFSLVAMMQSVSLFKVPDDGKASPFGEVAFNALALLIHTDRNNMQMLSVIP